jgi:hypothetical protein
MHGRRLPIGQEILRTVPATQRIMAGGGYAQVSTILFVLNLKESVPKIATPSRSPTILAGFFSVAASILQLISSN